MFRLTLIMYAVLSTAGQLFAGPPITASYIGQATWPGTSRDLSGLNGHLEDGSESDRLGGLGSGIAWSGEGNRYFMISDRGIGDGAVSYQCRFHEVTIQVDPNRTQPVIWQLNSTVLLTGPNRKPLVGRSTAIPDGTAASPARFDPESIRLTPDGKMLVTDEYGPALVEFEQNGQWGREWKLPLEWSIEHPAATTGEELPPNNSSGRQSNRGAEGLAITPDGGTMVVLMQGPLIQDGALDARGKRSSKVVRLATIDRTTGELTQYAYLLESAAYGLNEIEAINSHEFLVIERDGKQGEKAAFKRIAKIDIETATPLKTQSTFADGELPDSVRPVTKTWFIDLLEPRWGLAGKDFPEKTEGIALGPDLPDGRRTLLITSDNDFQPTVPTRVDVFALTGLPRP